MSGPADKELEIYRGDDYVHVLTFTDDEYPPGALDVSDYTFRAQIRDRPEKGVLLVEFDIDDSQAELGVIVLSLPAASTRIDPGYWDLQVSDGTSTSTWLKGAVKMDGDVTQ